MNNELTNEEKIDILNNLIKNIKSTKYRVEQEILAEQNSNAPSEGWIDEANAQVNSLLQKIEYLQSVVDGL